MIGVSTPPFQQQAHQTLCNFRKATSEELSLVKLYELKIVQAQANDNLDKLSQRTGNKLKLDFTSIINNQTSTSQLMEGDLIKIVTASPYAPLKR
jgi:predicted Zn-dependent protease